MKKNKIISKTVSGLLLCSMATYTLPVMAYTKDETVYTKVDSRGQSYNTIVSTHIINSEELKELKDISDLVNIENTKGDETFKQDGRTLVWNSNGNDVYYNGETNKELPIDCKVTYMLDDKEISAEDVVGKSGNITIKIDYRNKDAHQVNINGKNETLYTPFVVVAATMIDNNNNKNIKVSQGKVVDDGTKTIVAGIAMPGLQESLRLSKDDIDIPNSIEISMDAKEFELGTVITYITPKVIEEGDINKLDDLDEIFDQVSNLEDASKQLVSGANQLAEGAGTLSEKSKEFNSAINQFAEGVSSANNSYSEINNGIYSVNSGSKELSDGANQLSSGVNELNSKLGSLPSGVNELYVGSTKLNVGINGDGTATNPGLVAGVNALKQSATQGTETSIATLTSNNTKIASEIDDLKAEKTTLTNVKSTLEANSLDTTEIDTLINNIDTRIENLSTQKETNTQVIQGLTPTTATTQLLAKLDEGLKQVSEGIQGLNGGLEELNNSAKVLPGKLNELNSGVNKLATGSNELLKGTNKLSAGSSQMKSGLNKLDNSASQLSSANGQLTEGTISISDGANTLAEGAKKFDEEGIQKICNYVQGDVKDIKIRVEKLTELADEYNNFAGADENAEASVKFIMIMNQLKKDSKEESSKDNAILENEK